MVNRIKGAIRLSLAVFMLVFLMLMVVFPVNAEEAIYHAEEAKGEGFILNDNHQGYTGTAFIQFTPNVPGGYVEWDVEIATAGLYTLQFRYAHGAFLNRPGEVRVNDEVIEAELAFESTGAWNEWGTSEAVVELAEGVHTIRLTGVGPEGGPNIDVLKVVEGYDGGEQPDDPSYPVVSLEERINEDHIKHWQQEGLLLTEQSYQSNQPVKQLQFYASINSLFGYTNEVKFKGIDSYSFSEDWGIEEDEWYLYVLQAAHKAGYLEGLNSINVNKPITRAEVALVVASALQLDGDVEIANQYRDLNGQDELVKGAIGAVIANELLEPHTSKTFNPNKPLTFHHLQRLIEKVQQYSQVGDQEVHIINVDALSPTTIVVTLNGFFEEISPYDIEVVYGAGAWATLNPQLSKLEVTKASVGVNQLGYTVLVYELENALTNDAKVAAIEHIPDDSYNQDIVDQANNLITWQMEHGGWTKNFPHIYTREWDGVESRSEWVSNGVELGTIDNDATINEIRTVAAAYNMTGDPRFKESVDQGFEFLFKLQYPSGGIRQVYPQRGADESSSVWYSNYVTFNDAAMTNVLELFDEVVNREAPFHTDIVNDEFIQEVGSSIDLALDYILKAQIEVDGQLTAWGQQHDPFTYEPQHGRSYEHPSITASESIPVIRWLMARPEQTEEIQTAVSSALSYFDQVKILDTRYDNRTYPYFLDHPGSTVWYRFYQIGTDFPIFSGRDGVIKHNLEEIEEERRLGYSWAGTWPQQLLEVAQTTGYYENKVYARVFRDQSKDHLNRSLALDSIVKTTNRIQGD
ncbi:pectate lyase [Halalkalibacter hemicellulosilyticus]|uniref:Pectate lyase n=1 Tax=Halalkalibacter hemicellulosilyticusJCM 9152 TaxID=1236971 RepID=W4QBT2_9BACI|nr:pectate lyase [Halalkalibacter hemicellulosilyticus]GAE28854.1 pectate lyase [Halalkalibacter hemicellulosilyticusJCM 9152]